MHINNANVEIISCKDDETSSGFSKIGRQGGAMSYAFISMFFKQNNDKTE